MSLYLLEWPDIRSYSLSSDTKPKNRHIFLRELEAILDPQQIKVEEAMVISRSRTSRFEEDVGNFLASLGVVYEQDGLVNSVVIPVQKPLPQKRFIRGHVEITFASGSSPHYVGDEIGDYIRGAERVRHSYADGIRRGDSLIVYDTGVHMEILEALEKLGADFKELKRTQRV